MAIVFLFGFTFGTSGIASAFIDSGSQCLWIKGEEQILTGIKVYNRQFSSRQYG